MSPSDSPRYQRVKRAVKDYLGVQDDAPDSVSVRDFVKDHKKDVGPAVKNYVLSLFPFIQWLPRYNLTWLTGDLIAGITVGLVLVPQSLSYAKLADLPPQYGLYSSFIGVLTYAFFATSKDVSIGPVAVMSLETGIIVTDVMSQYPGKWTAPEIATCLAFICGFIVLGIGLLRIGWLVEFIPQPAVAGFMTGSAISIAAGQVPALLGLSSLFDTKAAPYLVIINTFKNLPKCSLDAAFGVPALAMLYMIKWSLAYLPKRYPRFERPAFFLQALRHAFVIVLFTIISWRINIGLKKPRISIVGPVPSGLQHVGPPYISSQLLAAIGPHIPVATIILLLEHISISKSFGRLNGYKINPNQELVAIGVNNTLGTVFSAYPSTGSFSRSALKSKSGVRTPAAGIATGVVVLVALYAVAPAFYYIPNAALSALIIHAVADLVASPRQSFGFWRVSPIEWVIFVGAVVWSLFYSIESGIYWSLVTSVVLLLIRIARPEGHFLGRMRIKPENVESGGQIRDIYVPICGDTGVNDEVRVGPPPPGIIIYRFEESFLYPNASYINDKLVDYVKAHARRGKDVSTISKGDRPWNDPGPSKKDAQRQLEEERAKPRLRAVILDFTAVANLDTTGVQNLIDTRREVEKWINQTVEFHFYGILSPWVRRALIAGGFGKGVRRNDTHLEVVPVVPPHGGDMRNPTDIQRNDGEEISPSATLRSSSEGGPEKKLDSSHDEDPFAQAPVIDGQPVPDPVSNARRAIQGTVPLLDTGTPFFHFDLADALNSIDNESSRN
ncbi:Sulfate permease 2 [Saitozyma sp. JCM 24511]|nr:Sulfate permease 2 [Saitozyma sp. JCM 24511]